ncbi:MAG TPA: PLP-dependent aminotransferase family protein [Firmicutes bacterium]|nr:PLP-dependent aminotransferase family protein [Bacillota bacterium]
MLQMERFYAQRVKDMRGSDIRDAFKLTEEPGIISFAGGFPAQEAFPIDLFQEIFQRLFQEDYAGLQYGPTEGLEALRRELAAQLTAEGAPCSAESIIITNGSQQALDLICKVLLDPGDYVLVEQPSYVGALNAIGNYQGKKIGIPIDECGLRLDVMANRLKEMASRGQHPKFIYTIPNFQNPTGVTLSLERRRGLLELAKQYDFLIIEDNPYGELSFGQEPVPHIKTMDNEGRVIYLGSFSKILSPGVRVGWLAAHEALVRKITVAKQGTDLCSTTLGMKIVLEALHSGKLRAHIESLRIMYRRRRDLMLRALSAYMPEGVTWTRPEGGFFIWLTLPSYIDTKAMLPFAITEQKVAYVSGTGFHVDGTGQNTIRLAFSQAAEGDIEEGIRRLSRVIRERIEVAM